MTPIHSIFPAIDNVVRLISQDMDATDARIIAVSRTHLNVLLNYVTLMDERRVVADPACSCGQSRRFGAILPWLSMPATMVAGVLALSQGFHAWGLA